MNVGSSVVRYLKSERR